MKALFKSCVARLTSGIKKCSLLNFLSANEEGDLAYLAQAADLAFSPSISERSYRSKLLALQLAIMNIFEPRASISQFFSNSQLLIDLSICFFLSDHSCLLLLSQIHKPCLPCQHHSSPLLVSPLFTFLSSCSCSQHHSWATPCLSGGSCHLFLLLLKVPLPSNSPISYSMPVPHLTATEPDYSSQFCLDIKWTHTENTEENLPVETKRPLRGPYWKKRAAHPDTHGYSYLGMVHVQSGHTSDF